MVGRDGVEVGQRADPVVQRSAFFNANTLRGSYCTLLYRVSIVFSGLSLAVTMVLLFSSLRRSRFNWNYEAS